MDLGPRLSEIAPPLHLLAGTVRNAREARCLVEFDCQIVRYEVILDHLLTCCAHERELERARSALILHCGKDPKLRAGAALVCNAICTCQHNIQALVAEADAVLKSLAELTAALRRYAERYTCRRSNPETCTALAAAHLPRHRTPVWTAMRPSRPSSPRRAPHRLWQLRSSVYGSSRNR